MKFDLILNIIDETVINQLNIGYTNQTYRSH